MKRFLLPVPVVVTLVALLWFGFGRNPSAVPDPLLGRAAPLFSLQTTKGQTISLKGLRGRPVVLSFFASWCVSCRLEEANLVQAYQRWRHQVAFFGIIYEDSPSAAGSFTRQQGGVWQDLVDPHSHTALNYGISGIPTTFFISPRGVITDYTNSLAPSALRAGIQSAVVGA